MRTPSTCRTASRASIANAPSCWQRIVNFEPGSADCDGRLGQIELIENRLECSAEAADGDLACRGVSLAEAARVPAGQVPSLDPARCRRTAEQRVTSIVSAMSTKNSQRYVMTRRYSRGASKDVKSAMHRRKRGTLKRGKGGRGGKVKSRKQAIAIGLSEARKKGKKVPRRSSRR
jgi:hypothetical protein